MIEIITGHCDLNKHLFTIRRSDSPMCDCGNDEETGVHLVAVCPRYRALRYARFGKLVLLESDLKTLSIPDLVYFIKRTGRIP